MAKDDLMVPDIIRFIGDMKGCNAKDFQGAFACQRPKAVYNLDALAYWGVLDVTKYGGSAGNYYTLAGRYKVLYDEGRFDGRTA